MCGIKAVHFTGKQFMAATEQVILVDEFDHPLGIAEKMQAHLEGLCHRAFSVFLYRNYETIELLIQQRAKEKYHSPSLWTNTCCSHPRPGENVIVAAERRLHEELGIKLSLKPLSKFHYIAHFDNGLVENEVDHVMIGEYTEEKITPNPHEVQAVRWVSIPQLEQELAEHPEAFTPWLKQVLAIVTEHLQ
jgi:isopentenyl-diphosphate delta-isomerase type 1